MGRHPQHGGPEENEVIRVTYDSEEINDPEYWIGIIYTGGCASRGEDRSIQWEQNHS